MQTRIYAVVNKTTGDTKLVESHHPGHALKMVTEHEYDVHVPNSTSLAVLIEDGMRVLRAPKESTPATNLTA